MIKLTERQLEILKMISNERTTKEIADNLGLAVGTVEVHRKTLFKKFKAKNVAGLMKRAFFEGFFDDEITDHRLNQKPKGTHRLRTDNPYATKFRQAYM